MMSRLKPCVAASVTGVYVHINGWMWLVNYVEVLWVVGRWGRYFISVHLCWQSMKIICFTFCPKCVQLGACHFFCKVLWDAFLQSSTSDINFLGNFTVLTCWMCIRAVQMPVSDGWVCQLVSCQSFGHCKISAWDSVIQEDISGRSIFTAMTQLCRVC